MYLAHERCAALIYLDVAVVSDYSNCNYLPRNFELDNNLYGKYHLNATCMGLDIDSSAMVSL